MIMMSNSMCSSIGSTTVNLSMKWARVIYTQTCQWFSFSKWLSASHKSLLMNMFISMFLIKWVLIIQCLFLLWSINQRIDAQLLSLITHGGCVPTGVWFMIQPPIFLGVSVEMRDYSVILETSQNSCKWCLIKELQPKDLRQWECLRNLQWNYLPRELMVFPMPTTGL